MGISMFPGPELPDLKPLWCWPGAVQTGGEANVGGRWNVLWLLEQSI